MIDIAELRLRALEREDLARVAQWMNDSEVRAGLARFLPISMAEEEDWYAKMLQSPAEEHVLAIEIRVEKSWTHIGNCAFHAIDWRNRSASVGIVIGDKAAWNQGHGTRAIRALLSHGFGTLNLHRIWLQVYSSNPRAIRCYEKAGFVQEGRQRDARFWDGRYEDVLIMSILRTEWDKTVLD
jgi:RimJ/RimL family protein N-acetyltransferase